MKILVCGGAGYIGSHTCIALLQRGHEVVVYDDFSNSSPEAVRRAGLIAGREIPIIEGNVRDGARLRETMGSGGFDAVIHFAAFKAVGESCAEPLRYYENNVSGTIELLQAMRTCGVKDFVFSSSATVYGPQSSVPVQEDAPLAATNPYGRTKLIMEQIISDVCSSDPLVRATLLRYFNPVGAHPSGLIGEDPRGTPNNLMPFVTQVAIGRRAHLSVFGSDYPTRDGTGVRDFIHVMDLAEAHVAAVEAQFAGRERLSVFNLGRGEGFSVLQLVDTFERVTGVKVPYQIVARRPGDIAELWADSSLAQARLGWRATRGLEEMCVDAWRWQQSNPDGFATGA